MAADDPATRRQMLVKRIVSARNAGENVVFEGDGNRVEYDDRTLRVTVDSDERERLDSLLEEYHVFKIEQPATRKADEGVVYLSAVTDAKHAADFIEALFRTVFEADKTYSLSA